MKLGLAYTVFNDIELIPFAIKEIKNQVNYIAVCYQKVSWRGNKIRKNTLEELKKYKEDGLIDDYFCFDFKYVKTNSRSIIKKWDIKKKNFIIDKLKEKECTHFLLSDADEMFKEEDIIKGKDKIIENDYSVTYCNSLKYRFEPIYLYPEYNIYIPFICKIDNKYEYGKIKKNMKKRFNESKIKSIYPYYKKNCVDMARIIYKEPFYCFSPDEVTMHHFTNIRKNINDKLDKPSAVIRNLKKINKNKSIMKKCIKVDNYFGIEL